MANGMLVINQFVITGARPGVVTALPEETIRAIERRGHSTGKGIDSFFSINAPKPLSCYERATLADVKGIAAAPDHLSKIGKYVAEVFLKRDAELLDRNVKPAISGLGVVADGDHRLGRF